MSSTGGRESCSSSCTGEDCGQESCSDQTRTAYTVLGVHMLATEEEIKRAWREAAKLWHPDRHQGDQEAKRRFQELQSAYEVLRDTERRHMYDLGLLEHLGLEEYLRRMPSLILTVSGLQMAFEPSNPTPGSSSRTPSIFTPAQLPAQRRLATFA